METVGKKPNQAVIDRLKKALADAELGIMQGFAMASVSNDDVVCTSLVIGSANHVSIAGAISILDKDFYYQMVADK